MTFHPNSAPGLESMDYMCVCVCVFVTSAYIPASRSLSGRFSDPGSLSGRDRRLKARLFKSEP